MANRAVLIVLGNKGEPSFVADESLEEMKELTRSAGGSVVSEIKALVERPNPATYVGQGKLEEVKQKSGGTDLLIFNRDLSPVQTRNIETFCSKRVVDRTGLILDIFARRAQSHEGRLQVELAQLLYLLPRLTGRGVLLSRLGGGIGTRGPGEKKLEYDRRRIRERISRLKKDIEKVRTHRDLLRKGRRKKEFATVAIIGYTNAGKSTLLNTLTGSDVLAEDKMFATLDPTTRIYQDGKSEILFSDTVGFIVDLPPDLIEAFQATLEEIREADALLHVIDATHPAAKEREIAVQDILKRLKVTDKPTLVALNKSDRLEVAEQRERTLRDFPGAVLVSARTKEGLPELIQQVTRLLKGS